MPTGVAIRDVREHLFGAAERILLRDGPGALTSRAVTAEAGVAKGVLHRHFADFDDFLAALVLDRIGVVEFQSIRLRDTAGTGTVAGNVTDALMELFDSVAVSIVSLIISRDELRTRLRQARPTGIPLLAEATEMLVSYLDLEREVGRIPDDAEVETLAPTLIGAAHLLFADRETPPPDAASVHKVVAAVLP